MSKHLARCALLRLAPKARSARRRYLARRLHDAGVRPVLEALIAVERGHSVDHVLEDFARIPPEIYHALGASDFPQLVSIRGGRHERPK